MLENANNFKKSQYTLINFGKNLEKLRIAAKMQTEYNAEKISQYTLLSLENIENLSDKLAKYEMLYKTTTEKERKDIAYGIIYTNKIITRTMLADKKKATDIVKYANVSETYIKKIALPSFYFLNFDVPKDNISIGIGRWRTIKEENNSFEIMQKENRYFNCTFFDKIIELNYININTHYNYEYNEYIKKLIKKSPYFEGEKVYFDQYVITKDIYDKLLQYEMKQKTNKKIEEIERYKNYIAKCEKHQLYHEQDIPNLRKQYNNLHNEGNEGYIPHFYTFEEYEFYKKELNKLLLENMNKMN